MSNAALFLVKGESPLDEIITTTAEVQESPAPGSHGPHRDLEHGDGEEEEYREGSGGRRCNNCSIEEIQETDLSKDIYDLEMRLVGANVIPVDSDDDGFRTPVSADHKIASASECPPAPRKPKPVPWRKRKLPPSDGRISLTIHLSDEEVEAMFPPIVPSEAHKKIKKARRDGSYI